MQRRAAAEQLQVHQICCNTHVLVYILYISYLHIMQSDSITTRTSGVFVYYMIKCVYYIPYILCYIYQIRISHGATARLQVFLVYMCVIRHICILHTIHTLMYISY